jgi:thioredoxin 2
METSDKLLVACSNCGTANRVPRERLGDDPRCGKCQAPLLQGKPVDLDPAQSVAASLSGWLARQIAA